MNDGDFSLNEFNLALRKKFKELTENKHSVSQPMTFILGGQPGAGKTGLQDIMKEKCSNNLVVLNGDEFRELHPDFDRLQEKYGKNSVDYTGKFSGKMTEALIAKLKAERYNVLVEGRLRTAEVPLNTCKEFKAAGYNVTLAVIAVKPQISYLSTIIRYEKMIAAGKTPRATAKSAHDFVVAQIPDNINKIYNSNLFDNIVIYNREGKCLYDMSKNAALSPVNIMMQTLNGKWSQHELDQFIAIGRATQKFMESRSANEIADFKRNVFNGAIVSQIANNNGLEHDYIMLVSENELDKLKKSDIKFLICRKNSEIAIKFNTKLKDKVKEILAHPKQKLKK